MGSINSDGWDAEVMFKKYLHDYLVKSNMHKAAEIFANEAKIDVSPVAIDSTQGFLAEWWSIFYDVYVSTQQKHGETTEKVPNKGKQVSEITAQNLCSDTSMFEVNHQILRQFPIGNNFGSTLPQPDQTTSSHGNQDRRNVKLDASSQFLNSGPQHRYNSTGGSQSKSPRQPRKQAQQRQSALKKKCVAPMGRTPVAPSLCGQQATIGIGSELNSAEPLNGWPLNGASLIPPHMGHQVLNSYLQSTSSQPQIEMLSFRSQQELLAQFLADAAAKALSPVPVCSELEMLLRNGLDERSDQVIEQIMGAATRQTFNDPTPLMGANLEEIGLQKGLPEDDAKTSLLHIKTAERALSYQDEERLLDESIETFLTNCDDRAGGVGAPTIFQPDSRSNEKNEHTGRGTFLVEVGSLHASKGKAFCCNFSPDGQFLASAGQDKKVFIWKMDTSTYTSTLGCHSQLITDVRFDPSSEAFATSSFDRTVQLWDAARPKKSVSTLVGHNDHVMSLDFHPRKMDLLCSCDSNDEIRFWDVKKYTCLRAFKGAIRQVRFQPQLGRLLATAAGNGVNIFDVETGDFQCDLKGHDSEVRSICWDVTGKYIASVSEENVRLWSLVSGGKCIYELHSKGNKFQSCTFHPGHPMALVVGSYQSLSLWNPSQSREINTIQAHNGLVASVACSAPTGLIASASHDSCVKLWR